MNIKRIVDDLGLTPEAFAGLIGASSRSVCRWLRGDHQPSRLAQREIQRFLDEIRKANAPEDHHAD